MEYQQHDPQAHYQQTVYGQDPKKNSNCGKTCCISCVGCSCLVIVAFVAGLIVVAVMGVKLFMDLSPAFTQIKEINDYFTELQEDGWEVQMPITDVSGDTVGFDPDDPLIWLARENPDDDWTVYIWEFSITEEAFEFLMDFAEDNEVSKEYDDLDQMMRDVNMVIDGLKQARMIPHSEAALEVHEELDLELPEDFRLDEWEYDPEHPSRSGGDRPDDDLPSDSGDHPRGTKPPRDE